MDHENEKSANSSTPSEKPSRSKLERALVWTVIGALVIVAGMEALARSGYSKTLSSFESAMEDRKDLLTLSHFQSKIKSGVAIQSQGEREGQSTIMFRWPSLLKKYELHLTVLPDEDQTLNLYATSEGPLGQVPRPSAEGDGNELADTSGGGGFGGPPGSHDEQGGGLRGAGNGPGGEAGPGGGQGGGRRGGRNPLQNLTSAPVVLELQLTDEQKTQVEELIESQPAPALPNPTQSAEDRAKQQEAQRQEVQQKLKEILNEQQFTRARQLLLHARGLAALSQDDVAEELKLTAEQREKIASIFTMLRAKYFPPGQQGDFPAFREESSDQVLAVLTEEQKQAWETLLGPKPPEPERTNRPQRPE